MHSQYPGGPPPPAIPDPRWNRDRQQRPLMVDSPPIQAYPSVYSPPPTYPMNQFPPHMVNYPHPAFSPPPEMMHPHMQHFMPPPPAPIHYSQPPMPPSMPIQILPIPTPPPQVESRPPTFRAPVSFAQDLEETTPAKTPRKLPWYSAPDEVFPKRKRRPKPKTVAVKKKQQDPTPPVSDAPPSEATATPALSTKTHSEAHSEVDSTVPSTPISQPSTVSQTSVTPKSHKSPKALVTPVVPVLPKTVIRTKAAVKVEEAPTSTSATAPSQTQAVETAVAAPEKTGEGAKVDGECRKPADTSNVETSTSAPTPTPAPAPVAPKSWADLVKVKNAAGDAASAKPAVIKANGVGKSVSLSEALANFDLSSVESTVPFLQPRGLINTGNMCFMNSVLQMLVFCGPFYNFLQRLGGQVAHSFKGDTPLFDAMISLMREYRVLEQSAVTGKNPEEFGEAFIPELVYDAIKRVERFSSMRRGHQQDAEEFLGFLLDGLHEEMIGVMKQSDNISKPQSPASDDASGWLEVGVKGKAATTRSTEIPESPITKIFGGKLRSEFKVSGVKPSVTLEPYQPLQIDIQSPQVHSIVDALKHFTTPEVIHGDFSSPRGRSTTATKQVFVETFPPVLILHLKRFQYDNTGGTQKIWKTVGYPLVLDIPSELVAPVKRTQPRPRYKLIGVIYHHGKYASGGHYTVDVLRQDGKSWIRLDDTKITKIAAKDVAVSVDPKQANATAEQKEDMLDGPWEYANGTNGSSKASQRAAANSAMAAHAASSKDGKVAYILFYQKM